MKKIVILSDTHGNLSAIYSVYDILLESDMVFHLGDHYDDMNELESVLDESCTGCTATAISGAIRKKFQSKSKALRFSPRTAICTALNAPRQDL